MSLRTRSSRPPVRLGLETGVGAPDTVGRKAQRGRLCKGIFSHGGFVGPSWPLGLNLRSRSKADLVMASEGRPSTSLLHCRRQRIGKVVPALNKENGTAKHAEHANGYWSGRG